MNLSDSERDALRVYFIKTRWGGFRAVFSDVGLRGLSLPAAGRSRDTLTKKVPELKSREGALGRLVRRLLDKRLAGRRGDLPWEAFDFNGRPPFFRRVWRAMHAIPFGETRSYGDMAKAAGSPKAVRAAGQACVANPVVLFIPCHRVVAARGPGGFGAGLACKKKLLALEGCPLPEA